MDRVLPREATGNLGGEATLPDQHPGLGPAQVQNFLRNGSACQWPRGAVVARAAAGRPCPIRETGGPMPGSVFQGQIKRQHPAHLPGMGGGFVIDAETVIGIVKIHLPEDARIACGHDAEVMQTPWVIAFVKGLEPDDAPDKRALLGLRKFAETRCADGASAQKLALPHGGTAKRATKTVILRGNAGRGGGIRSEGSLKL